MNPTSTLRVRRATALLAGCWALLAIVLSIGAMGAPSSGVYLPFIDSH